MASISGPASAAGEAELDLHGDFYPVDAVEHAAAAFAAVATCTVERRGPYHHVRLVAREATRAEILRLRFANYALAAAAVADPAAGRCPPG